MSDVYYIKKGKSLIDKRFKNKNKSSFVMSNVYYSYNTNSYFNVRSLLRSIGVDIENGQIVDGEKKSGPSGDKNSSGPSMG